MKACYNGAGKYDGGFQTAKQHGIVLYGVSA